MMAMDENSIRVFREVSGAYQCIGSLKNHDGELSFEYDREYLDDHSACAISRILPLHEGIFSDQSVREFFDGLLPEGSLRKSLSVAVHADESATFPLLSHLNNESSGALIFGQNKPSLLSERGYQPLDIDDLAVFARTPQRKSLQYDMASRLSLAGAQGKVGLYHEGDDFNNGWFLPEGSAPSTHIVKASDGTFPLQSVNEALCLRTAKLLGYDVEDAALVKVDAKEPLLVVTRFDRICDSERPYPIRLHQVDFCQELGFSSWSKYEPTDGNYVAHCSWLISRESSDPLSDRTAFALRLVLDWALGNCDNHLKNHSFVWNEDWNHVRLSPLYDIACTTFYSELSREMGISLSRSRRIDDVTVDDIKRLAASIGIGERIVLAELDELLSGFQKALETAERQIISEGFPEASRVAAHIRDGFDERVKRLGL